MDDWFKVEAVMQRWKEWEIKKSHHQIKWNKESHVIFVMAMKVVDEYFKCQFTLYTRKTLEIIFKWVESEQYEWENDENY